MGSLIVVAEYTDKKVGDDHIFHHHSVGVGHSEFTPVETALPVRMGGVNRSSIAKCVVETGSPITGEVAKPCRVG